MLAIIGGTGLTRLVEIERTSQQRIVNTPYGKPSSSITLGILHGSDVAFIARHGEEHTIAPHQVNYRANIWALKEIGVSGIVATAAVGSINKKMPPGELVIPDQLIDYTWGRPSTFFETDLEAVRHIDFTNPYSVELRSKIVCAMEQANLPNLDKAVYGCTQGPRLETAAEIQRLKRDGCDLVGMTGMPEAALARELGLEYACCAVVVNWAAGLDKAEIKMEDIQRWSARGMEKMYRFMKFLSLD